MEVSKMSVTIREAREGEWEKVPPLHRDEGEEYMQRARERNRIRFSRIPRGKRIVLFAEQEGRVVGALQLQLQDRDSRIANGSTIAHFDDLVVDPGWRGQGIGSQLLTYGEECLREKGFAQATLGIRQGITCAALQEFYKKHGYAFAFAKEQNQSIVFTKTL